MPDARRIILGSLLLLLAISGCDCEARVRQLVSKKSNEDERIAARTEVVQQEQAREIEPNDGPESATSIILRRELRPVYGALSSAQDIDWFSVATEEESEDLFELIVTPLDSSLDVALYLEVPGAPDAPPLLYDVARAGQAESVPILSVGSLTGGKEPLRFFVAVSGSAESVRAENSEYKVEFRRRLSGGMVESEPNDQAHLATKLKVPGEIQGFYDRPRDQDIYYVAAEDLSGSVYRLEVSNIAGLTQRVRVFADRALEEALLQLTVSAGASAQIPNFSVPEGAQGLWIVLTAGDGFDRERGYRLKIIEHAPVTGVVLEGEPNDTAERAQRIEPGAVVRGYLHDPSDVDRFRWVLASEDVVQAEDTLQAPLEEPALAGDGALEEVVPVDPLAMLPVKEAPQQVMQARLVPLAAEHRLGMRWISGQSVQDVVANAADEALAFCNVQVEEGTFDLEVRSVEMIEAERPVGGAVAARGFDYELRVENIAGTPGLEVEPNDRAEIADRLEPGQTRIGYISRAGDVDVFGFAVTAPQAAAGSVPKIVMQADGLPGLEVEEGEQPAGNDGADAEDALYKVTVHLGANPLNLEFSLFDDEGGQIAHVNRAGPGADENLVMELPAGVYFVVVKAERGAGCEPYRLTVRWN